ncbi:unnamed protein product [[Actinomadura] parvosata subsp. kistnae]|nr:hypothetical protein [Nonomuraea sp. ATCC 55076]SPL96371.1 unnamed protein product [Actinomadura parvosata subsp. kistnae]
MTGPLATADAMRPATGADKALDANGGRRGQANDLIGLLITGLSK